MREGRKGFGTYRVCPKGMEPDVSEFVVPAECEEDFAVAFEEVHLERKSRRQLGILFSVEILLEKEVGCEVLRTNAGRMLSQSMRSLDWGTRGVA